MASRTPSLNDRSDIAVSREIDSKYDDVKKVADSIDEVVLVANNLTLLNEVNDARTELLGLLDVLGMKEEILALYGISDELVVLATDIDVLNSLYADKAKFDSLFADKAVLDSLYADKESLDALYANKAQFDIVIANLADIVVVGENISSVVNVAGSIANVNTLVPNLGNVDLVADNMLDVNGVAENVYSVGVVARNISDINTIVTDVVPNMAEVLLVDERSAQVAQNTVDVTNMKEAVYNTFYDFHVRYLGSYVTDPETSYWGDPLIDGAMYFNTSMNALKVYDLGEDVWITVPQMYLSGLRDVELTSVNNQDILVWDGVNWVNRALADTSVLSATKLTTGRNISITGDMTWDVDFDGSTDVTAVGVLKDSGVTAGEYKSVVVDSKGIVTAGSNPTTLGGFGIVDAYTKTEVETSLPKIGFDTTNTVVPSVGQMAWNQDESTVDLGLMDAVLQIGQEFFIKIRNASGSAIANGTVVMASGSIGNSGRITVVPHDGTQANASRALGVMTQTIADGADGLATIIGKVRGIDTTGALVGETWADGTKLCVKPNDNGRLTMVESLDTEIKMEVAYVVKTHTNGTLYVRVTGFDENHYKAWVQARLDGKVDKVIGKQLSTEDYTTIEKTKLAGIETEANKYIHPVSGVTAGTYSKVTVNLEGHVTTGAALADTDIPGLDASKIVSGLIDSARLPAYVDDVLEFADLASFPAVGETGKIYVDVSTNKTYRWSGSVYIYITSGAVDSVNGQTGVVSITSVTGNAGTVTNGVYTGDIGVSVQPYNANTIIDANYVHTDNNFTTTLKTKLDDISGTNTGDQTITLTGDVTGSGTGSFATTLSDTGVIAGTYKSLTVDIKGRVTSGTNPTTLSEYGVTDSYTKTEVDNALALKADTAYLDEVNLLRADKYLAAQNVANMSYDGNGKLSKVQYNNATDVDYEVLTYNVDGKLSNVAHYTTSTLRGNTILSYSAGKLVSAIYTGV